jgi:hypothetical protein
VKSIQLVVISVFLVGGLLAWWFYLFIFEIMYRRGLERVFMFGRNARIEGFIFIGMTIMIISATLTTGYLIAAHWKYRKFLKDSTRVDLYQRSNELYTIFWKWFTIPAVTGAVIIFLTVTSMLVRYIFGHHLF